MRPVLLEVVDIHVQQDTHMLIIKSHPGLVTTQPKIQRVVTVQELVRIALMRPRHSPTERTSARITNVLQYATVDTDTTRTLEIAFRSPQLRIVDP